jgi:hypothetical protein
MTRGLLWVDQAEALLSEAAALFRQYEAHHQAEADRHAASGREPGRTERQAKADRNAEIAARIEAFIGRAG